MTARRAELTIRIADHPEFVAFVARVHEFVSEYAWHTRDCAAIDVDGEWHRGSPPCSCGYNEALALLRGAA